MLALPALLFTIIGQIVLLFKKSPSESSGRIVLLNGGKMTKCLQLARLFKANGDRVIVAETPSYKYCGARFTNALDKFHQLADISGRGEKFKKNLVDIAQGENVQLYIPVSSPKSALYEAQAKLHFPKSTTVFQVDEEIIRILDDKHKFVELAASYGLSVPESHRIESMEQLLGHDFTPGRSFILKKLDYDPVYRLDLRQLPYDGWERWAKSLPISSDEPWVLQEFITGREVCTHTTTQNGQMNLYICCDSSPFQVNYKMLDLPEVKIWVTRFIEKINVTGQLSFDFIIAADGRVIPIECNPRTHSAITLMYNQPESATAYYKDAPATTYEPNATAKPTYWIYHELYRLVTARSWNRIKLITSRILHGKEAVFAWNDPWPFFFQNHVGIPYQLWQAFKTNTDWTRIDFNIGKLVIPGGD